MPTIKISKENKTKLENIMAIELKKKFEKSDNKEALFMMMVKKKYGITFDNAITLLLDKYPPNTQ